MSESKVTSYLGEEEAYPGEKFVRHMIELMVGDEFPEVHVYQGARDEATEVLIDAGQARNVLEAHTIIGELELTRIRER